MANLSILDHKAWPAKAHPDLGVAKLCLRQNDFFDAAVYHTQQAAEKALKAFLVFHTGQVIKKHDLMFLVDKCTNIDFSFIQLQSYASGLNVYATYARYPDDNFVIDYEETTTACKKAAFIFDFVKDRLPISNND